MRVITRESKRESEEKSVRDSEEESVGESIIKRAREIV